MKDLKKRRRARRRYSPRYRHPRGGMEIRKFRGKVSGDRRSADSQTEEELQKLKKVISTLRVDKVQLNTVVRPPAESNAKPVPFERMEGIRDFFGEKTEIIADFAKRAPKIYEDEELRILDMLKRRPCMTEEISDSLGIPFEQVMDRVNSMLKRGIAQGIKHEGRNYYIAGE